MQKLIRNLLPLFAVLIAAMASAQGVTWQSKVEPLEGNAYRIVLEAKVPSGYHMYDLGPYEGGGPNPTVITFTPGEGAALDGEVEPLDPPHRYHDDVYGMEIGTYEGTVRFAQKVTLSAPQALVTAQLEWMICDDTSCMPPEDLELQIAVPEGAKVAPAAGDQAEVAPAAETPATKDAAGKGSIWALIIEAILWGFAALLTPCVFPMVPMTVSFFLKQNESRFKARIKAGIYGLSIVALYTVPIAVIILITKWVGGGTVTADIFNWIATHWLPNVLFFLIFIVFAISFFGAFEITLPSRLVNRSDRQSDRGGVIGIFFMALTLVLVSFSCTGPIVGAVLIQSTTGAVWTPVLTMLAFSVAFALPFTLLALFPSMLDRLPRSGGWLNSVKVVLGFIELALALKFLSVADQTYHWGILDREVYLAFWIVIFTLLGFYLLGKLRFPHDSEVKHVGVTRLLLAIVTFSFVVYMLPGMWGAPLRGLSGYLPPLETQDFRPAETEHTVDSGARVDTGFPREVKYGDLLKLPHGLQGFFDLDEAMDYAKKVNKPLFVDYTGHGCVNCREMEARVWSDPQVLDLLRNGFVVVALYSDDKKQLPESDWITTEHGKVLKGMGKINAYRVHKLFGINAQPYYMILGTDGEQLVPGRGYDLNVDRFVAFLQEGIQAYREAKRP